MAAIRTSDAINTTHGRFIIESTGENYGRLYSLEPVRIANVAYMIEGSWVVCQPEQRGLPTGDKQVFLNLEGSQRAVSPYGHEGLTHHARTKLNEALIDGIKQFNDDMNGTGGGKIARLRSKLAGIAGQQEHWARQRAEAEAELNNLCGEEERIMAEIDGIFAKQAEAVAV